MNPLDALKILSEEESFRERFPLDPTRQYYATEES